MGHDCTSSTPPSPTSRLSGLMMLFTLLLVSCHYTLAFQLHGSIHVVPKSSISTSTSTTLFSSKTDTTTTNQSLLSEIRSMRVKQLKQELESNNIATHDVFEKEELVMRLYEYRKKNPQKDSSKTSPSNKASSSSSSSNNASRTNNNQSTRICRVPFHYYSLDGGQSIASNNNVFIRPSPGKFAAIKLKLSPTKVLTMLVDTACSGVVIRPSSVQKYDLPKLNSGVSMTAAGGTAAGSGLSSLQSFTLEDGTRWSYGSLPAAIQDMGALPSGLDGIVGLSFLNQFESVIFDFELGELCLINKSRKNNPIGDDDSDFHELERTSVTSYQQSSDRLECVAEGTMKLCKLGIWSADITFDGRGPVSMLVDTGAASTFLDWEGTRAMNLGRDHPLVSRNLDSIGAMGADNSALALTHRFVTKRRMNIQSDGVSTPRSMFAPGIDITEAGPLNVDIGDLPVLQALRADKVGGILGNDLFMRSEALLLTFDQSSPRISLWKRIAIDGF